jgi:hypothetical protein
MRAVVGRVHDDGVVGDAQLVEVVDDGADVFVVSIIVSWYGDCQRPACPMLSSLVCV